MSSTVTGDASFLAPRPTYTRRPSDEPLLPTQRRASEIMSDGYSTPDTMQSVPLDRRSSVLSEHGRFTNPFEAPRAVQRSYLGVRDIVANVAPYWREGVFVVTTVGFAVWVGVLTGQVKSLQNVPMCNF